MNLSVIKRLLKTAISLLSENSNVIGAISGVVSIVVVAFSAVDYIISQSSRELVLLWLIIAVIMLIVALLFCVLSYGSAKAQTSYSAKEYYGLLHDYRNGINELESQFGNDDLSVDKQKQLLLRVKSLIQSSLDHLVDNIKFISKEESISACVKLIDYSHAKQSSGNSRVSTFVRDSRCPTNRCALDEIVELKSVLIRDNTDFSYFFKSRYPSQFETSIFYVNDLLKYDKKHKDQGGYSNTTPNWQEYYIGTAIVPIRIKTKRIDRSCTSEEYTIIGFLCVDTKSASVFIEEKKQLYTNILKSYAALLFQILYFYMVTMRKAKRIK